ncbi:MAG TPA: 16S rRNA (uracil(1498)-N(3))-methyltransferase [Geminicoccaceae bacterium]|nr:16S rRNA (uracil(1498)-N(3))-methyltransferase [Geminicoccaceae bacterium]
MIRDDAPAKIRLYLDLPLTEGGLLEPSPAQCHYLLTVMRRRDGDTVALFNGRDGEWLARVELVERRRCRLHIERQSRPQRPEPGPTLLFAPLKRFRQEFLIEKATELGVAVLAPVLCRRSVVDRINRNRLVSIAIEAAEQCGRLTLPEVDQAMPLAERLATRTNGHCLFVGDETGSGQPVADAFDEYGLGDLLIGPEGGFDPEEMAELRQHDGVIPISLGPRTLRAETAALAALACWQALLADD